MPESRHVVVRADASADIGLGHVMRSVALARELETAGLTVTICGTGIPSHLSESVSVVAPSHLDDAATVIGLRPDLVVVDGYHFSADFFVALDHHDIVYAVIDDNGDTAARRPRAVVNQNPHADASMYGHLADDPLLMLGVQFAMFRHEIVEAAALATTSRNGSVFVAFGGSDPRRLTRSVALQLAASGLEVRVAVGAAHPDRSGVETALADQPGITMIEPADYAPELAAASGAVLAAGSSLLEAGCLGTPALAVVVAENQRLLAGAARERGLVCEVLVADEHLPANLATGVETLRATAPADHPPVPADGARRVAQALMGLITDPVRIRPASFDDAEFLFELRTDDEVRRQSFHEPPDWEHHLDWFRAALDDPDRRLMIVEAGAGPVGQIRLDTVGDHNTVSLAIAEPARGCGTARRALAAAKAIVAGDLVAHVKPDNGPSLATFSAAGFMAESTGPDEIVMRWSHDRRPDQEPTA